MEVVLKRPAKVGEEINSDESGIHIEKDSTMFLSNKILPINDPSARLSSSMVKDSTSFSQEDQLESTKAEMVEVREENQRLRTTLTKIIKDYQSLQMHFSDIFQQQQTKKPVEKILTMSDNVEENLSLSLGTCSSGQKKEDTATKITAKGSENFEEDLTLRLDCRVEGSSNSTTLSEPLKLSPDNSSDNLKEDDINGESWPPNKTILKSSPRNGDDEASQQPQVKKARVSVRTRCDGPTMNDGCQWRKYGQKISKGNPCPRAYYRCTIAPSCPVRKQVQRCAEDMSILITTYEGTHNHPLPVSATAMASTTAAAASMLMSGSSASQPATPINFLSSSSTNPYLPNSSISSTSAHPTVTLDLTAPPTMQYYNRLSSNYSSSSFNFSSSSDITRSLPTSWSNPFFKYGAQAQPYNNNPVSLSHGRQSQDSIYHPYLQKASISSASTSNQHPLITDTIAKVITSDPKFHSALTAAISSYVEARGGKNGGEGAVDHHNGVKMGEHLNSVSSFSAAPPGNGCATSFLNRSTGLNLNPQQGSRVLLQSEMGFPGAMSASASPEDHHNRGNIK
ncbi:hypothetical protein Cni_G16902 [Canna indica]|uniref:WRKY domain-containing protein n=1 Tax=Canna indica TaxID=4628 RepID=A0AAQ3KIF7_9LILI|nr:hypothetical protein Cni_G16902 [Canna indica]